MRRSRLATGAAPAAVDDASTPVSLLEQLVASSEPVREVAELMRAVYTPQGVDRFLTSPMAAFDGRTALELLERGQTEPVLAALAADYEGLGY